MSTVTVRQLRVRNGDIVRDGPEVQVTWFDARLIRVVDRARDIRGARLGWEWVASALGAPVERVHESVARLWKVRAL